MEKEWIYRKLNLPWRQSLHHLQNFEVQWILEQQKRSAQEKDKN